MRGVEVRNVWFEVEDMIELISSQRIMNGKAH